MSAEAAQSATEQLLAQGILGIAVLAAVVVIVFLQRRNDALHEQIGKLNEQRLADRDLRLQDAKSDGKVLLEVSDQYKEALLLTREELRQLKEEVGDLKEEIQSLRGQRSTYR